MRFKNNTILSKRLAQAPLDTSSVSDPNSTTSSTPAKLKKTMAKYRHHYPEDHPC